MTTAKGSIDFIDNLDGNTLAAAVGRILRQGVPSPALGLGEATAPPRRLDIATAFFSPAGFAEIAPAFAGLEQIRLLVGAEPPSEVRPPHRALGETPERFERRLLNGALKEFDEGLREERDRFPFSRAGRASLKRLINVLRSGRMQVRRYERAFLHAKAYIFAPDPDQIGGEAGVIAGSSNLTRAGMLHNLELNLGRFDAPIFKRASDWYEHLWDEAEPFDIAEVLEEVFADWTPFDIFLRVLDRLYGSEVIDDSRADEGLPLTNFQKHGVARAIRLIRENGGAIVADEVGLGKTFIAGEILKQYDDARHRCLLVCPAQLRDTTWKKFRSRFHLKNVECVSYEQLAADRNLVEVSYPSREVLERPLHEYQLVVVDEAHNYRNPDTPTRARVLRRLLWDEPRDVLLLTATPVNNSLWDLYHLINFFIRQDSFLADRGVLSLYARFKQAAQENPSALSPDLLYPVVDATTVKRTRQFVKRYYSGDTIRLPDGTQATIVFPEPRAVTLRYPLTGSLPDLFDRLERALDPDESEGALSFARYHPTAFLLPAHGGDEYSEDDARAAATMGLLRSGLLKRFESSAFAFGNTLERLLREHEHFLEMLDRGWVVDTKTLKEISGTDDEDLDELLHGLQNILPATHFRSDALRRAVQADVEVLQDLCADVRAIRPALDPKLATVLNALRDILVQAENDAVWEKSARNDRKVLIFSFFADTVAYLRQEIEQQIEIDPRLHAYRGRIVAVAGSTDVEEAEVGRQTAVSGFAPVSTEASDQTDRFDILITTDALAEGVNLQQCRNIINYDVPWNPMRLVQRHGRIDRIGSVHRRVFLRTVFPAERLDQLLNLEQRILAKIALAAASVGVVSPVDGGSGGSQIFSETREEIDRLLAEDASLFERGGAAGAGQSGEEYRQTLRKALGQDSNRIRRMPLGVGSGMIKGQQQGVFFCAAVDDRTYLRFLPTDPEWNLIENSVPVREIGSCLRLIECETTTSRHFPEALEQSALELWSVARHDIYESWMVETDPANLQPRVRPLNLRVADFIREHRPADSDGEQAVEALNVLEAPWPLREELLLRTWFTDDTLNGTDKAKMLIARILETGLRPFVQPPVLPPINHDDVALVCWLGIRTQ